MTQANPELFVNDGPAGSPPARSDLLNGTTSATVHVEYLFLVNGQDDDNDGFVDNGWDGVDNDQMETSISSWPTSYNEWTESEKWLGSLAGSLPPVNPIVTNLTAPTPGLLNQSYTITRRPAPSSGSREVALPSNVVIDLTTWATTHERSRFPLPPPANGVGSQVINPKSGSVDILVNPDGTVVPSTVYSSPSSFGLNGAFLHFWLAERSDVTAPPSGLLVLDPPLPPGSRPRISPPGRSSRGSTAWSRFTRGPGRSSSTRRRGSTILQIRPTGFLQSQYSLRGGPAGCDGREPMTSLLGRSIHASCLPPKPYLPGRAASMIPNAERAGLRRGITLTEILISILILGVGLVSLATLFPIGLLRLREAQRQTRSAYLYESAAADVAARGLLNTSSFAYADLLNTYPPNTFNPWYYSRTREAPTTRWSRIRRPTGDPFANWASHLLQSGPPRQPLADMACHSRMIRSGAGRPTTPTAASISSTRTT